MAKILIIRFSSIGDIVLTTPVIRALKQQIPAAEVHVLTKARFQAALAHNPYIDRLWTIDSRLSALVIAQLRKEKYTYIVDLHNNLRSCIVRLLLQRPGASFPKLNFSKWLLVRFGINRLPLLHIVDRYFEACRGLAVKNDGSGLDFFTSPDDEAICQTLPSSHQQGYVALCLSAQHITKKMPLFKWLELVKDLTVPTVILGGPEDVVWGQQMAALNPLVLDFCGKTSLGQSAALIKQSGFVLCHDTGLMHIAAAFQKNILSIWGNTIPAFGMYPYLKDLKRSHVFEISGLKCRPCSKIGYSACPKKHFRCMTEHNIPAMRTFIHYALSKGSA